MPENIKWIKNKEAANMPAGICGPDVAAKTLAYHAGFEGYAPTPLLSLNKMARYLNLGGVYVKDESRRFTLKAFKVLGASYAMGNVLAQRLGMDTFSFEMLTSEETKKQLGNVCFYTATDGNHGRAVAWTAARLGQKAVVYMPKGTSPARLDNILREGAQAEITELNYDDTVRFASEQAAKNGGILIQDTAWSGYEQIPKWIMQGYCTLIDEAIEQMGTAPTHVFLQAGVGSFAAAVQDYLSSRYGESAPVTIIVEPSAADCFFRSMEADDGKPRFVTGDMPTLMAGLACGEPSTVAFEVIKKQSQFFASCPDRVTAYGMRMLGNPLPGDPAIVSGESGAVGMGLLYCMMRDDSLQAFRESCRLNSTSRVLLISTEGDTDPARYRDIVWHGRNEL